MVAAPGLSAALQGAQLPTSFAAMAAAAAGLNPGLMASSQFAPGLVLVMVWCRLDLKVARVCAVYSSK